MTFYPGGPAWKFARTISSGDIVKKFSVISFAALSLAAGALLAPRLAAADDESTMKLLLQNSCHRCHAITKNKNGPSWTKVAEKYRSRADAQERLIRYVTSGGEAALFPDGHEEDHKAVHTNPPNDKEQIAGLVKFILSF